MRIILSLFLTCSLFGKLGSKEIDKPNVLLIAVDDLNDWIGCLEGHPQSFTPNIDRLADRGILFSNAHCQGTMCNPSRISLLWGRRPSSTGFYDNHYSISKEPEFLKQHVNLPTHFASQWIQNLKFRKNFSYGWLFSSSGAPCRAVAPRARSKSSS